MQPKQPYILLLSEPTVHAWWAIWSSTVVLPQPPKQPPVQTARTSEWPPELRGALTVRG
jgi:hypothetical protein